MPKWDFMCHIPMKKTCIILVEMLLFSFMIYSLSFGIYPARYPDWSGGFVIQLDQAYYQIWGDQFQVYAVLSELWDEQREAFEGRYYVLLLNTREAPASSFYNKTETMDYSWKSENGSRLYFSTTISALTTPIKEVVTIGDTINFNLSIEVEEDLLFKHLSLQTSENATLFTLRNGLNILFSEIKFTKGIAPHEILAFYRYNFMEGEFNSTKRTGYGYQEVFDIDLYKNMTNELSLVGWISYRIWLLPFSARIIDCKEVNVEHGKLFVSFPLNVSLSADKIALASYAGYPSYILDVNPVAIYSSPPVTVPLAIMLILLYELYFKWRSLLLHLLKYKIFYTSMLLTGVLLIFQYLQILLSDVTFPLILSFMCIGFISVGVVKNNFTKSESKLFWKTLSSAGILLSVVPAALWTYFLFSSQTNYETYLKNVPVIVASIMMFFLGACFIGIIVNSFISYLAGFFLFVGHLCIRIWHIIQHEKHPSPIDASRMSKGAIRKRFIYYVSELSIVAIWFIILISSSAPVSLADIQNIILRLDFIMVLIILWAFEYLLFHYELLKVMWCRKVINNEGVKLYPMVISPKLFHRLFSVFALITFIAKLYIQEFNYDVLLNVLNMLHILLILSSGFALGFIGTHNTATNRARKEITRIGKRYTGILV